MSVTSHNGEESALNAKKNKEWHMLAQQFNSTMIVEERQGRKPAKVIIDVAKKYKVTQILLGQSARTRWEEIRKG